MRPEAKFSDGSPVTVEDVIWSMQTLSEKGLPRYRNAWEKVAKAEQTGPRSVRFTFEGADSELPLIIGLRPILKQADWDGIDFAASSLRVPVGSGPYTIGAFEPGRFISFERNPDYWGRDLPINRGTGNFDTIRYEYFVDAGVLFQAFTAGALSVYREASAANWQSLYDLPRVRSGEIVKEEIPHGRPSGMEGFVFNTRRPLFQDWRVRDALLHAFNFEFVNRTLNGGAAAAAGELLRQLGARDGRRPGGGAGAGAAGAVRGRADTGRARRLQACRRRTGRSATAPTCGRRRSSSREAGWTVKDGVLQNAEGKPFAFEILLGSSQNEAVATIFGDALRQLGIQARVKLVDQAQYNERRNAYDYDMIVNPWSMSLSPGNEQTLYWGSAGVSQPGRATIWAWQPGRRGDDRRPAGDRRPGGVHRGGAGARPGADHRALRDSILVQRQELDRPQGGPEASRAAAGLWRLDRLVAGGLVAGDEVADSGAGGGLGEGADQVLVGSERRQLGGAVRGGVGGPGQPFGSPGLDEGREPRRVVEQGGADVDEPVEPFHPGEEPAHAV